MNGTNFQNISQEVELIWGRSSGALPCLVSGVVISEFRSELSVT